VKWAGPDNKLDTDDDVVFIAKRTSGVVRAAGLPAGKYAISSTGSFSGAYVTATAVSGKTVTASIATLAATGTSGAATLAVAALLMLVGGALVLATRRRLMN
jgi:LPXTG-motif cell wall-anchored protein